MESFKRLSLDELCFSICESKRTLIIFHVRSDADAVGSAFALRDIFRVLGHAYPNVGTREREYRNRAEKRTADVARHV